jgi:hypothetical protein
VQIKPCVHGQPPASQAPQGVHGQIHPPTLDALTVVGYLEARLALDQRPQVLLHGFCLEPGRIGSPSLQMVDRRRSRQALSRHAPWRPPEWLDSGEQAVQEQRFVLGRLRLRRLAR